MLGTWRSSLTTWEPPKPMHFPSRSVLASRISLHYKRAWSSRRHLWVPVLGLAGFVITVEWLKHWGWVSVFEKVGDSCQKSVTLTEEANSYKAIMNVHVSQSASKKMIFRMDYLFNLISYSPKNGTLNSNLTRWSSLYIRTGRKFSIFVIII